MSHTTKYDAISTRTRILNAAEAEMFHRGVTQTSLERIARHAQLTRGAIYWHFKNKSELLEAMVQRTAVPLRELQARCGQESPDSDPRRSLKETLLHTIARLTHDEQHRRICHIILHRCEMNERDAASTDFLNALFEDARSFLIAACNDINAVYPLAYGLTITDAADLLITFLTGLYECSLRHPDLYNVEHGMEHKVETILNSVFPLQLNMPSSNAV